MSWLKKCITKIALDKQNRMVRAGVGKHNGKWFIRVDLWVAGFRLARADPPKTN